jgi:hypothetical protein
MTLFNVVMRTSILVFAVFASVASAHPGHSHFGSADEPPSLFFLVWMGVILAMSVYGGWRLFRTFFVKDNNKTE